MNSNTIYNAVECQFLGVCKQLLPEDYKQSNNNTVAYCLLTLRSGPLGCGCENSMKLSKYESYILITYCYIIYFLELMCLILQYQECPPYIRKSLCPESPLLNCVDLLHSTSATHHLRRNQWCSYRDGVVVGRNGKSGKLVDVGLGRNVVVNNEDAENGTRVTVMLPKSARVMNTPVGELVSADNLRMKSGLYWGYTVRLADSLAQVCMKIFPQL